MDSNKRRTNNNDQFFNNPIGSSSARPRPPPPPPPPIAGSNRIPQQPNQSSSGFYSNTSSASAPPPPPPRPAAAPRTYPTAYPSSSSTPSAVPFTSNPPAPIAQQQNQRAGDNIWFDEGVQTSAPAPTSNPSSEWYSTAAVATPQTYQHQQPQQQQQAPMSIPQQQPATFNPAAAVSEPNNTNSALSGSMQPMTQSSSYKAHPGYNPSEFLDEPPLLEELGINIPHIIAKSRAVILPVSRKTKEDQHLMDDDDLAGPLFFGLLLGGELLLSAKIHFGYIYGFGMFAWLAMSLILNLLSPPDAPISIWTVMSILGYSLLPVNALAAINIFIRMKNMKLVGFTLASIIIIWCTLSSTRLFEKLGLRDQRYLIAYPAMLVYSAFVILTIF